MGVAGYRILRDGAQVGTASTYRRSRTSTSNPSTTYTYTVRAFDAAGNAQPGVDAGDGVHTWPRPDDFQNDVLATGFDLPTNIEFLPDGRMLVAELQGTILVLPPPYTQPDPTPFLQLTNVGSAGVQQGLYDIALDPSFVSNHYYYVFYTAGTPNNDRLSRFTANARSREPTPAANSSCTRIRATPTTSITAALSPSATTASLLHDRRALPCRRSRRT